MNILVIGAGAMGSLFAGRLSRKNKVFILDKYEDRAEHINTNGLIIEETNSQYVFYPHVITDLDEITNVDLILIAVKSYDTEKTIRTIAKIVTPDTSVISLQNGAGNLETILNYIPKNNLIMGTTSEGSTYIKPGRIRHAGAGTTSIGCIADSDNRLFEIANTFNDSGFNTHIAKDIKSLIFKKLFVNAGINPVCALFDSKNRIIHEDEKARNLCSDLVKEAVAVVNASGYNFNESEELENVFSIANKTSENICSMLQDVRRNKQTEILAINGYIASLAKSLSILAPHNTEITRRILELSK